MEMPALELILFMFEYTYTVVSTWAKNKMEQKNEITVVPCTNASMSLTTNNMVSEWRS